MAVALLTLCLAARSAHAGPPYVTDDPEPTDFQHWEVYGFSTGTQVAGGAAGFLPATEINYGATPNLQLHVIIPLAYNAPYSGGTRIGIGDVELGTKYRFLDQDKDGWVPEIAAFPLAEVPAGDASRGLGAGHAQFFLPLWLQKDIGRFTLNAGGGFWINPGAGNRDFWLFGALVQYHVTERLALGAEIYRRTAPTEPGRSTTAFNGGVVYDFNDHWHLLASAGQAVQNVSLSNRFSYYLGIQNTF